MDLNSFIIGILLAFIGLQGTKDDNIKRLEKPVSYENKKETSFQVFQVIGQDAALASEISDKEYKWYHGKTVVLVGDDFYSDQVIDVKNPQRVGTYTYTTKRGMPMTVPIIKGEVKK
jgi:hypothetical protein